MNNICIVGAGGFDGKRFNPPDHSFIIAADNGLKYLEKLGIEPDIILGDFDSYGKAPSGDRVLKFPSRKNYTDIGIAIEYGLKNGGDAFYIYGGLGGPRFGHSVANIQLLYGLSKKHKNCFLIGENEICTAIGDATVSFSEKAEGYVSIFSLSSTATISVKGLSYSGKDMIIKSSFPLGVSNEFTGKKSRIEIKKGHCLIIWHGDYGDISIERNR